MGIANRVIAPLILTAMSLGTGWAQVGSDVPEAPTVDVKSYLIDAEFDLNRSLISGTVEAEFIVLQDTMAVPFNLSRQLTITEVTDAEGVRYSMRGDDYSRDRIRVQGDDLMMAGSIKTLTFKFEGQLEKEQYALLDLPSTQKAVIEPDGAWLLSEGYWFPSHQLAIDSAVVSLRLVVPLGFTAVAPGTLGEIETLGITEAFNWSSSDEINTVPVLVSRYYRQSLSEGGIPLTFFVGDDFDGDLQPFATAIWDMVDFYSQEYGPAPVEGLSVVESGNITLATSGSHGLILLEDRLLKSATFPTYELARRVAQQWWGYSVRPARAVDAWLADGFANYAALRYFQVRKGDEFQARLNAMAVDALKYQDQAPVVSGLNLEVGSPKYESIVGSKGAWVLYMLGQLISADTLNATMKEFYGNYAGQTAAISDFTRLINEKTADNYSWFFTQWLESVGVPEFQVDYTVYKLRDGGFKIRGQVKQNIDLFRMPMDVLIETKGKPEDKELMVNGKTTPFVFDTETTPIRIELDPKGRVLMDSDRMQVQVSIAKGDEFRELGEYVSAVQEYERAIDQNPRSSLAHFRLGQSFFDQHSYSNAANSMRDSLNGDLKPDWVETWAHIYMGKVYDILGQRQRARAEYQKALNSKIDYNGAQAEARKYLDEPYSKPNSVIG
jgi:tetratricopeptide (TPR) repeat protein